MQVLTTNDTQTVGAGFFSSITPILGVYLGAVSGYKHGFDKASGGILETAFNVVASTVDGGLAGGAMGLCTGMFLDLWAGTYSCPWCRHGRWA